MYVHPLIALLALLAAGLAGAAISFIWVSRTISKSGKIEHTVLSLAYAVSLLVFIFGMSQGERVPWALPAAVMLMGSGTAWANWRAGVHFWLVFALMTVLGGASMLVMEIWVRKLTLPVFFALNIPWMALMLWLVFMISRWAWGEYGVRRT